MSWTERSLRVTGCATACMVGMLISFFLKEGHHIRDLFGIIFLFEFVLPAVALALLGEWALWRLALWATRSPREANLSQRELFFLGLLTPCEFRDVAYGCAEERFQGDIRKVGLVRARLLFYRDLASECVAAVSRLPRALILIVVRLLWKWTSG